LIPKANHAEVQTWPSTANPVFLPSYVATAKQPWRHTWRKTARTRHEQTTARHALLSYPLNFTTVYQWSLSFFKFLIKAQVLT